ncbi:MAG: IS1634 family transposase [Chloroflexota bacterium]
MYIRKASRSYKGKTYTNHLLVQSIVTPKGPRQKVICSLGDLSPRPREQWLDLARKLESALTGQQELLAPPALDTDPELEALIAEAQSGAHRKKRSRSEQPRTTAALATGADLVAVHTERIETERIREAGPVHVGYQFWRRLGMDEILPAVGLSERERKLSCAMTLNRLVHPSSELAMPAWIRTTALPDILETDFENLAEDALYRQLDKLHPQRVAIESALAERERTLFSLDPTLFFYDLTSTYFEGLAAANPKAQRGYSRDKRPDCKQVVVGLAVTREGFPLAHEVFAGNRHDSTTVDEMLDALDRRIGLKPGQTVVVDRGLSGKEEIKKIQARGLHYLVAMRQTERDQWLEEFENDEGFQQVLREPSPTNPYQKKSNIEVKLQRVGELTYVLCRSSEREQKDGAIRQWHEQRLLADLEKLEKRVAKGKGRGTKPQEVLESMGRLKERYPRVARYYRMEYDPETKVFRYSLDEEKRTRAEKLDGSYLLKSDRGDLTSDEAWRIYMTLTRAEAAFRAIKSPLAERPIFHQKEQRVEAHIFLCVLAYHLLISIEKTLLDQGVHTSWATVRETLKTHQVNTVVLPTDSGLVLRIRKASTPEPAHRDFYQKLRINPEVIRPRKSWS